MLLGINVPYMACEWRVISENPTESRPDSELLLCSGMLLEYLCFPSELWRRQVLLCRINSGVGHGYCVGRVEAISVHDQRMPMSVTATRTR